MLPLASQLLISQKVYQFTQPSEITQNLTVSQEQFILNMTDGRVSLNFLDDTKKLNQIDVTDEYINGVSNNSTFEEFQKHVMESRLKNALASVTARTTLQQIRAAAPNGPPALVAAPSSTRREISPELKDMLERRKREIETFQAFRGQELSKLDTPERFAALASLTKELPYEPLKDERDDIAYDMYRNPIPKATGRFNNVFCPEATSVRVENQVLHANYVRLEDQDFICTQAPLPQTVPLFWRAVLQNSNFILDLTNKEDMEKKGVQPYFPENKGVKIEVPLSNITVECLDQNDIQGDPKSGIHVTISKYKITDTNTNPPSEKVVLRLHYRGWPDFGAVKPDELLKIVNWIDQFSREAGGGPAIVHCRAGVGRTGTTSVGKVLWDKIMSGEITKDNFRDKIDALILLGRFQRSSLFVQTAEQYESLYLLAYQALQIKESIRATTTT